MTNISEHSWNSEPEVGELLGNLLRIQGGKSVLEIGVFKGMTYKTMQLSGKTYAGIDIEDHRDQIIIDEMESDQGHVFILGDSLKVLSKLKQKYDLIFIDSVHEYDHCMAEFKICEGLINKGGIIAFHDSIKFPGVTQVIDYIKTFPHFDVITLDTPYNNGLTIVKCNYP